MAKLMVSQILVYIQGWVEGCKIYIDTEGLICYIDYTVVIDLSVRASTIHKKTDLIRYVAKFSAEISNNYKC